MTLEVELNGTSDVAECSRDINAVIEKVDIMNSEEFNENDTKSEQQQETAAIESATTNDVKSDELPEWLTIEFFQDALEKVYGNTQFNVRDMNVSYATKKGDNYASIMYRTKLTIETESEEIYPVIVKALPFMGTADELMKIFNVFPKEIRMYAEIIPKFEALFHEFGEAVQFGPKFLKSANTPTDILVLEDLSAQGYKMVDRQKGLDMTHTKVILEKLAKFHAASAVCHERNGDYGERFVEGMYSRKMEAMFMDMFEQQFQVYLDIVRTWSFGKEYADIMQKWKTTMYNTIMNAVTPNENSFNVLLHGDMWCNNSMFRYDDKGDIEDVILVDYQMCFWGSPAVDLNYFIISSTNSDIKLSQFDYFVKFYHDKLTENLKLLQYQKKIPTLKELQLEMLDRGVYGTMTATNILSICLLDPTDEASMDTMMRNDEVGKAFKHKLYGNPKYMMAMKDLFPFFHHRGVLDFS